MPKGRPPLGPSIVDCLDGSSEAKRRLKTILEVLSKGKTVEAACEELGVERARYYVLQHEALLHALEGLEPRRAGRPPNPEPSPEGTKIEELEREVDDLKFDLTAAQIREELAKTIPKAPRPAKGAEPREKKRRRKPR